MPWAPATDFEEEIINLQPDHDFIYGGLSEPEPQPAYPRPKAHVEYAFNNKKEARKQQELYEATGRMNEKLHVITQIQRMAGTKPLGEQPTLNDWDSSKNVETETIGMMRFCGMGPSLEEPLNNKVTIATYPVENNIRITRNGRKKVPVFFDENVFKLKPKVSNSSSGFDSATSSSNSSDAKNDSVSSQVNQSIDTSFNTSASSLNHNSISFYTGENNSQDSNNSITAYEKAQMGRESLLLKAERMRQYDKLQEETASLSISNVTQENDSFKSAEDFNSWTHPCYNYDEDYSFNKNKINWPPLEYNEFKPLEKRCSAKFSSSSSTTTISSSSNNTIDTAQQDQQYYSGNTSQISTSSATSLSKNFLQRFITPEKELSQITISPEESFSSSSSSAIKSPSSYADMAKKSLSPPSQGAKPKSKKNVVQLLMPRFYTTREIYDMKRRVKN